MSGSISRKRKHKAIRQGSKDEARWYVKFFSDLVHDNHEDDIMFPNSEYTALTSDDILRLTQGSGIRRK